MSYRDKRNHEAAHAVVAAHFDVPFNKITQYKVDLPKEAASLAHFKKVIAAGCLGEFYKEWSECVKNNEERAKRNMNQSVCLEPIKLALERFNSRDYKDDGVVPGTVY